METLAAAAPAATCRVDTALMLPSLVAEELRQTLTSFLGTTFALTDDDVRDAMERFLLDGERGIFRGPYVRVRLPFRAAEDSWREHLGSAPAGFTPYRHQAQAFARLDSRGGRRPQPTVVTTGTGSGKTESFLLPVLDHCRRERAAGRGGVKALLLYPMNALANDQARRIAAAVARDEGLAGVTVGLYIGDAAGRQAMGPNHVIEDKATLRREPPDVLLTNYKMLDHLLLRPEDQPLWERSRESLTYLVVDEFHTYDGAQGTDVAMLLRRLGAALGVAEPDRPLGRVTPVATSATLGEGTAGVDALLDFAAEVFGETLTPDAVVGEDRLDRAEWLALHRAAQPAGEPAGDEHVFPLLRDVGRHLDALAAQGQASHADVADLAAHLFWKQPLGSGKERADPDREVRPRPDPLTLGRLLPRHPLTGRLAEHAERPVALDDLLAAAVPEWTLGSDADRGHARAALSAFLSLVSEARVDDGGRERPLLAVDVQVWVREVRRLLRRVTPTAAFSWETDTDVTDGSLHLPAVYCRHCGRSGWAALRQPAGPDLETSARKIWAESVHDRGRLVALLHAAGEAAGLGRAADEAMGDDGTDDVRWFLPSRGEVVAAPGTLDDAAVPVLRPVDAVAAKKDRCPACGQNDGIRFLGSRVATLVSVLLGHLFGSPDVPAEQKKTLVFTDSVQDAAHRASFVEARAFALNLRAALARAVLAAGELTLDQLGAAVVRQAEDGTPSDRYALLPPDLQQRPSFAQFWSADRVDAPTRRRVVARLQVAAVLELGLSARTGRSLELTGTVAAAVVLDREPALVRDLGERLAELPGFQVLPGEGVVPPDLEPARVRAWLRGVLERVRLRGGVDHRYFRTFRHEDGRRWSIWGGRERAEGMPAFPSRRPAPAYPVTADPRDAFDSITASKGWYARWTSRCLRVPPQAGPAAVRTLLDLLVAAGQLQAETTQSGATVWSLPPDRVVLRAVDDADLAAGRAALRCTACATRAPGPPDLVDALLGAPCLREGCPGTQEREPVAGDYYRSLYRSGRVRRIVAREHTGLLPKEERLHRETAFKRSEEPDAPNVLVCTPTLELGIDIGELSVAALTSLPSSTASYLQRVGRAGRQTGNALVLAVLPSRPLELQRMAEPLEMIAGDVVPPACYLDAAEILQRQYLAFLVDRSARAGAVPPRTAGALLGSGTGPSSWLGRLLAAARTAGAEPVEEFLALFADRLDKDSRAALREWAGVTEAGTPAGEGPPPLERAVAAACQRYADEQAERARRTEALSAEVDRLATLPDLGDEHARDVKRVRGELARARAAARQARQQYWIAALESVGLLPSYSLLDDRTTLDVALWWTDEETGRSETAESTYARGSRTALTELAPGAVFYVRGSALHVDAVDLGSPRNPAVVAWRACPSCGWAGADTGPRACPRCHDPRAADTGARLAVVPFRAVSAYEARDEAFAADESDEREKVRFTVVTQVDVAPQDVSRAWRLAAYPFGAEVARRADVRWLNVGRSGAGGATRTFGGEAVAAPLFRACRSCGVVPAAQRKASGRAVPQEEARHRGWCPQRRDPDPDGWVDVALLHELRTQVVRLLVPPVVMVDETLLVSFRAALLLGLREVLGGDPDHLDVVAGVSGPPGAQQQVMVLHDLVPGGTGYLARFRDPAEVQRLLAASLARLEACPCAGEPVAACHRCLLAHVAPHESDHARRDRAVALLGEVLEAWEPQDATGLADITVGPHETPLERRFRQALRDWLARRGTTVQSFAEPAGDRLVFRLPMGGAGAAGDVVWTLRPQVPLGGVMPDFVLTADRLPLQVAVFADGLRFHSSAEHNRVADDAEKRAALREQGFVVWAVTHEDVDEFRAGEPDWHVQVVPNPASVGSQRWTDEAGRTDYLRVAGALTAQAGAGSVAPAALTGDAVTVLLRLLQRPDLAAWRTPAGALGVALVGPGRFDTVGGFAGAPAAAAATARGAYGVGAGPGDRDVALRRTAGGAGLCLLRRGTANEVDVVAVVDDRDEAVGSPTQVAAWRDWLALSNLLPLADEDGLFQATTTSLVAAGASGAPSPAGASAAGDTMAHRALRADVPELDDVVSRLHELAAASAAPGYEVGDGYPLDLAWATERLAVLLDEPEDEVTGWLSQHGWRWAVGPGPGIALLVEAGLAVAAAS